MRMTEQQRAIVEVARNNDDLIARARAGTGKTSVIEMIGRDQMQKKVLLLCFNKSIERAATARMPNNMTCRTFHSIGFATHGKYFQNRMNLRFMTKQIAKRIGHSDAITNAARYTIKRFTSSDSQVITGWHVPRECYVGKPKDEHNALKEEIVCAARKIWLLKNSYRERDVPVDFDDYLKAFELDGARVRGRYDTIIVDEAQDITPRDIAIINKIPGQRIMAGDDYQQIYAWRGSINSLDAIGGIEHNLFLTQSFRFGEAIANAANNVLSLLQHDCPPLMGLKSINSDIRWDNKPDGRHTVLCRTNSGLLSETLSAIRLGKSVHVIGTLMESVNLLESAWYMSIGEMSKVKHPTLLMCGDWESVVEMSKDDTELGAIVRQVELYSSIIPTICEELRCAGEKPEHKADVILSSVHRAKGREWEVVRLADDFPELIQYSKKEKRYTIKKFEVFTLYVAVTRAMHTLFANSVMSQINGWREMLCE